MNVQERVKAYGLDDIRGIAYKPGPLAIDGSQNPQKEGGSYFENVKDRLDVKYTIYYDSDFKLITSQKYIAVARSRSRARPSACGRARSSSTCRSARSSTRRLASSRRWALRKAAAAATIARTTISRASRWRPSSSKRWVSSIRRHLRRRALVMCRPLTRFIPSSRRWRHWGSLPGVVGATTARTIR